MTTRAITVPEITCGRCKTAIEGVLNPRNPRADAPVAALVDQGCDVPAQE